MSKLMHLQAGQTAPSSWLAPSDDRMTIAVEDDAVFVASGRTFRRVSRGDGRSQNIAVDGLPDGGFVGSLVVDGDQLFFSVAPGNTRPWTLWRAPVAGGTAIALPVKLPDFLLQPLLATTPSHLCWAYKGGGVGCVEKDGLPTRAARILQKDRWPVAIVRSQRAIFWLASDADTSKAVLVSTPYREEPQ
jgi:hypothetical protein